VDHLDELEAQSIYIFREAFARLKKLALLWSLGKDSNVMIWLARKAFFGRVPFPAMHVDTGKKFPEMYAFRDRYAKEWGLDLKIEPCPPIDAVDPTLPPAARSAARKTEGLKLALAKHGFDGLIAGIRRDEEATRAKERVFSPRGTEGGWDVRRNSGISSTPRRRPAHTCAFIRSCIGPRPTSGPTPSARTSRSSRCICRITANAIARSAMPTSPSRWRRRRRRS
jgi:3'-phosphoadenosine 5'-phosphosulfate sulfotransferase (PAPS reductase)/FAD synthetase